MKTYTTEVKVDGNWVVKCVTTDMNMAYHVMGEWIEAGYNAIVSEH